MSEEGKKFDSEKLRWTLIPWKELEEVVKVLEHGAKKYSPDNWKNVKPPTRYLDAGLRHIVAYSQGEKIDLESGFSHLSHAIASLLFVAWHDNNSEIDSCLKGKKLK